MSVSPAGHAAHGKPPRAACKDISIRKLGTPSEIGIFTVSKEIAVEEFAVDRNVLHHCPPIEASGAGSAEYIFKLVILAGVGNLAAAVEMA